MTPEQFCYWLQGRLEMSKEPLTPEETQIIRDHLATVFTKVTPDHQDRSYELLESKKFCTISNPPEDGPGKNFVC